MGSEQYYTLDEIAARIWDFLQDGSDSAHLVAAICSEYEIDAATAQEDVEQLLMKLISLDLVRPMAR
jgi:hypothetical protein